MTGPGQLAAIKLGQPQMDEVGRELMGALRIVTADNTGAYVVEKLKFERHRMPTVGTS